MVVNSIRIPNFKDRSPARRIGYLGIPPSSQDRVYYIIFLAFAGYAESAGMSQTPYFYIIEQSAFANQSEVPVPARRVGTPRALYDDAPQPSDGFSS